jgi:CubicO group peptidase (beta-lactamase class C family)
MPDMLPENVELRRTHALLKAYIERALAVPPLFPPGTDYSYQSMGTLVVAEIIQRLSGQTIRDFLQREIFEPLGLQSITLGARGWPRERLVRVQVPDFQAGSDFGWNSAYWQQLGAPWGGIFSSPEDLAVICQLMLGDGAVGGVRILSPGTVLAMRTNRLHDQPDLPEPARRAKPWGLGWQLNPRGTDDSWGDILGLHVFGHTGATGTMCWIDPDRQGFCILLTSAIREKAPWRLVSLSNAVAAAFR